MTRWIPVIILTLVSCQRPGESRAARDLSIGKASTADISVVVDDGLAAVRSIQDHELTLWQSAPGIAFELTAKVTGTFTLTVRNTMPGAVLSTTDPTPPGPIEPLPWPIPTTGRWRIPLTANQPVRLTLAAPDASTSEPFRFAVLADVQDALPKVGDIYRMMNADPSLRFVFCAGDLTEDGSEPEIREFQERLAELAIPLYATVGNHELFTLDVPYFDYFGRSNIHYAFKGVHFTLLDSGDGAIDPLVNARLDTWLAAAKDAVHIFGTHIPPFEPSGTRSGAFASRMEAAQLVDRLSEAKVDLTLYGHVHSFYAFSNGGIPAYIAGGGGAIPEQFDGIGRHYLVVDVDPATGVKNVNLVRVD